MSQKPNPVSIGLFIVIGVALGVTGLLLFSSSKLFTKTLDCVIYFDQSLNGLNVGAPVKIRGVTIGSVKRVMVRFNQATNDYAMPVIIELEEKLINERLGEPLTAFTGTSLEERVKQWHARVFAGREPGHRGPLRRNAPQPECAAAGLPSTEAALSRESLPSRRRSRH